MARVFLVNPPSPEPVRTPLLSFCHLAAALRAAGHAVALVDLSAPCPPADALARIRAFAPDAIGIHVKTLHVQPAYAFARAVADALAGVPLIAGGPHATIAADEVLAHGFAFAIRGEGENALVELADALDRAGRGEAPGFAAIAGLSWRDRGLVRHAPARPFNTTLDRLAPPLSALELFEPAWYGSAAAVLPPAGMLASRGCPAACTFCSNDVTGRKYRYRSPGSIADELGVLRGLGVVGFSFFDDSFAVGKRRVRELCAAMRALPERMYWTCTAHPAHLDPDVIEDMESAGCRGIDLGMESADPDMLVRIGKGVTVARVLDVLRWCRERGVDAIVNLMFGWPDETDAELGATIDFMDRAAEVAGGFNARGVVVPYPGTAIYEANHARFGFTRWWLDEPPLAYPPFPTTWDPVEIERAYATDPALDRNFFRHPPARVERIRAALWKKARLTSEIQARRLAREHAVPAAGAR